MKKLIVVAALLYVSLTSLFAQHADGIKGVWVNDAKDAKVEIYKSGDKYFGKITWVKEMYEADGRTPKKDSKNSDEKLRSRNIVNMVILSGFTFDDGEWTGGELYDPKSGKTYKSKMKLKGDALEIRGYVGSPMFGKTTIWTKAS
ncbi:MAG TPA: DUF2147 domain-containing protein [Chitinophagaceae bacterium]